MPCFSSATTISNKISTYFSYVVVVSRYGPSLRKRNKSDIYVLERNQPQAVMWILNTNSISYKDMFINLGNLLLLPQYQKFHVSLLLAKIQNGKVDKKWRNYVNITDTGTTRKRATRNFSYWAFRLLECNSDFWLRACHLSNMFNNFFKKEFLFDYKNKEKLLQTYFNFNSTTETRPLGVCSVDVFTV